MDLLIDLYQQGRIAEAHGKAANAIDRTKRLEDEVDNLKRKCDALTIACQSLWEIVRTRLTLDEQIMLTKMQEIDLRDGKLDGKIATKKVTCPNCSRHNNTKRHCCLYCGRRLVGGHLFEKV
jgi:hypothetical protein